MTHDNTTCPHCGRANALSMTKMKNELLTLAAGKPTESCNNIVSRRELEAIYLYVKRLTDAPADTHVKQVKWIIPPDAPSTTDQWSYDAADERASIISTPNMTSQWSHDFKYNSQDDNTAYVSEDTGEVVIKKSKKRKKLLQWKEPTDADWRQSFDAVISRTDKKKKA